MKSTKDAKISRKQYEQNEGHIRQTLVFLTNTLSPPESNRSVFKSVLESSAYLKEKREREKQLINGEKTPTGLDL